MHVPLMHASLQTLINLSMTPELLPKLQLYKVPDYIHQVRGSLHAPGSCQHAL